MKINFDISPKEFYIIRDILQKHLTTDCKVWVFGSRAKNQTKYNSDLDIALEHSTIISPMILASLRDDLDDSLLPYQVDIIDINEVSTSFKQIINTCKISFPISLKKNIPRLRFPEFKGEWEEKKLGNIGRPLMCKRIFKEQTTTESNNSVPFYKIGTFGSDSDSYIPIDLYKKYKSLYSFPNIGDILISASGTIGRLVVYDGSDAYYQDSNIVWLENNEQQILNTFLFYCYSTLRWQTSDGGIIKRLYNTNLRQMEVYFPNEKKEQQKIANFLTAIDNRIQTLEKKKTLLEQYKKGVMQKIFKQELRFKDDNGNEFEGEWEEISIGKLGKTFNGLTGKSKEDFGSGKPYIQYKQIFGGSFINLSECEYVVITSNEKQNEVLCGDIFFTTSSETPLEIGYSSVLLSEVKEVYLNSFCFGFRINSFKTLSPKFAQYLFRSDVVRKEIIKLGQGSTRYNMSKREFIKIKLLLPSQNEQQKIANFLSSIDKKIKLTNKKIKHTKSYKKGLLQQMLV